MEETKPFMLSIVIENLDKDYSQTVILDHFDNFNNAKEWVNWLEEIYNKVKKKRNH